MGAAAWREAVPGARPAPHRPRPPAGTCPGRLPGLPLNNQTALFSFGDKDEATGPPYRTRPSPAAWGVGGRGGHTGTPGLGAELSAQVPALENASGGLF